MNLRARIDQERAERVRRFTIQVSVVKYRAVLVDGDDVPVGQLIVTVTRRLAIGLVNCELRLPFPKGSFGGAMSGSKSAW